MAERITIASLVATFAFWAYTRTLLPGVDLGDTGGFQAAVLWPEVSARQAYPLYYGLARPFVRLTSPANPARALNLFSAVWAAAAVGLLTFVCASVTRSLAAGAVAGALLAFSYTFWTQAVIAEVYALHLSLIGLCLLALHAYATRPVTPRLLVFFGVYAASFGNHLGMILLLVPFALFLIQVHPAPRELVRPRVVLATALIVAAGALQYAPNLMAVWGSFSAPDAWTDRVAAFWFDATKQDWRETMVFGVGPDQVRDRLAMWWFDARQQFGVAGLALAAVGAIGLWRTSRPWGVLVLTSYALTAGFALTYNVGDSHVFFLPGHYMTALCAGAALTLVPRAAGSWRRARLTTATVMAVAVAYAGWRAWSTWPAVDRHDDRRGDEVIAQLARGVGDGHALLVPEMNWQLENVLLYAGRYQRPDLTWVRLGDVMAHWPFLVGDNHRLGRDVVLNAGAAAEVAAAYGPSFPLVEDTAVASLPDALAQVPRGVPYVLGVLTPLRERPLDPDVLAQALSALTNGRVPPRVPAAYELLAGMTGDRPQVYRASNRPFTERFRIADEALTVRMDSWLPSDTFRRAGFGHVLQGRRHMLILERGVNLVWIGRDGLPSRPYYAASLFAIEPRYRIPAATPQLASTRPQGPPIRLRQRSLGWPEP
ncbi:MAG: protein O-mannosyl-transferase family [Vicinamibacterales bacterium]